jgi:hypothetical protein
VAGGRGGYAQDDSPVDQAPSSSVSKYPSYGNVSKTAQNSRDEWNSDMSMSIGEMDGASREEEEQAPEPPRNGYGNIPHG